MIHPDDLDRYNNPAEPKTCRICKSTYENTSTTPRFGLCERCGYKILVVFFIGLIVISYMMWFGVF